MADNRLLLVCKTCRKATGIAKCYGIDWAAGSDPNLHVDKFMARHRHCAYDPDTVAHPFDLAYEDDGGDWEYDVPE